MSVQGNYIIPALGELTSKYGLEMVVHCLAWMCDETDEFEFSDVGDFEGHYPADVALMGSCLVAAIKLYDSRSQTV